MPIHNFSVGDRVLCVAEAPDGNESVHGLTGTVLATNGLRLSVCWDAPVDHGHNCNRDECEWGHGWNVWSKEVAEYTEAVFELCPEEALVSILSV